jgi:hypothetical protein
MFSKNEAKESMATIVTPIKISSKVTQKVTKKVDPLQERKKVTIEEKQSKEYPFFDSDISSIFDELMAAKAIELAEAKSLKEVGRINDHSYYKYHHLIDHPIEKYFVFKDKII